MTEEEAKQKWCPFVRINMPGSSQQGFNRTVRERDNSLLPPGAKCIGSACMAWRTSAISYKNGEIDYSKSHGHCGLAGKP